MFEATKLFYLLKKLAERDTHLSGQSTRRAAVLLSTVSVVCCFIQKRYDDSSNFRNREISRKFPSTPERAQLQTLRLPRNRFTRPPNGDG